MGYAGWAAYSQRWYSVCELLEGGGGGVISGPVASCHGRGGTNLVPRGGKRDRSGQNGE